MLTIYDIHVILIDNRKNNMNIMKRKFDKDWVRLTDCCGCYSSYDEYGTLYCRGCSREIPIELTVPPVKKVTRKIKVGAFGC